MKNIIIKIIAVSLCISLVLPIFAYASVTDEKDIDTKGVIILKGLGLLPDGFEDRLNESATRGDAADLFAGLYDTAGTAGKLFKDVDETTVRGKNIAVLHEQGIINGSDKGNFSPDDMLTSNELICMSVRALGGELYASYNGGFPVGYSKALTSIFGMRLPASNTITISQLISFFCKIIDTEVVRQTTFGATEKFGLHKGETLLKQQKSIIKITGIVTANSVSGLYCVEDNNEDGIIVEGVAIQNSHKDIDELLGYRADVYYHKNHNDEKVAIVGVKSDNEELVLDEKTYATYKDKEYTYYINNKKRTVPIGGEGFALIYNGVAVNDMRDEYFALNNGEITLIDNNNDGIYNVVKVNNCLSYVVDEITAKAIVYKDGGHIDLDVNDTKYRFYNKEGNEISYSDLAEGAVISVFVSADNKLVTCICANDEFTGILGQITTEDDKEKWLVDNKEYIVTNKNLTNIRPGMRITVKLDYKGKIVYAQMWDQEYYLYAYLGACKKSGALFSDGAIFILFDDDGNVRQAESGKKVKIDGLVCSGYDAIAAQLDKTAEEAEIFYKKMTDDTEIATLRAENGIGQMIRYKLNKDGYVSEIDTAAPNMGDDYKGTLHMSEFGENSSEKMCLSSLGMLGKSLAYNGDTTFLWVPVDMRDVEDFYVDKGGASMINKQTYNAVGYYTDDDMIADYILIKTDDGKQKISTSEWSRISVVSQKMVTLNEDDEEIEMISYYEYASDGYRELTAIESTKGVLADIEVGDVVRCALYNGEISSCDKIYDCSDDMIMNTKGAYTDYLHLFGGSVFDKKNGVIAATPGKIVDAASVTDFNLYNHEKFNIIAVDYGREVYINQGSSADIRNYTEYQENSSQVIIQMVDNRPMTMIVINR